MRKPISLSILVHALAVLVLAFICSTQDLSRLNKKEWTIVEVDPLPAKKKQDTTQDNRRVVQTTQGERVKEAKKDAYLGEHNQIVDRETVSKIQQTHAGKTQAEKAKPQEASQKPLEKPTPVELAKLGLKIIPTSKPKTDADRYQAADALQNDGVPQDYIKGMKESDATALNTREFMFFGYFQRIRERLDRAWNANLKEKLTRFFYGGRRLASETDHTTRVMVTLDETGDVTRVQLLEESGTRDLDDAAIKAFNQAGPFPNPPKGILNAQRQISIRWEFVLRT